MRNLKGKKRKLDGSLTTFWLKQIEDGSVDAGLDAEAIEELKDGVRDALKDALTDEQQNAFKAIADTDEAVLMTDIATENRRLRKLKKRLDEAKEDLHADQQRLEYYTRAREKQEESESNEMRDMLNADAKAVMYDNQNRMNAISPRARARLKFVQAIAERQGATEKAYNPQTDPYLQALLERLSRPTFSTKVVTMKK